MIEIEEFISFFYNIKVDKINIKTNKYKLEANFKRYQLVNYEQNADILYKNYVLFRNNNVCCHDLILNKDGNILSEYEDRKYLLLKENVYSNKKISENEILNSILLFGYDDKFNIKEKWKLKNDHYESMIEQIAIENEIIKESFDYYIGLSELAINLLNYVDFNNISYYLQHNRIYYNETLEEFYNPINMVIDSRIRDFALYLKSSFFNNINQYKLEEAIYNLNLSVDESILFIARLIYPDYYFDILDEIINNNINNIKLMECIKKSSSYEEFLKKIYKLLYKNCNIPKIGFLIN